MSCVKPNKNLLIECHHCNGDGMIPLSDDMQLTLNAALKMRRITVVELAEKLAWKGHITAINNRMTDLMKLGFFTRKREGRDFVYTPVKF